jgi:glycosyltransferase involved in cell wall biosynthesis
MDENLTLLIPAKNESESLPTFLKELEPYKFKTLIVLEDDDEITINSINSFSNVSILKQNNKGYGSALIEGINFISTKYFCIINADGSMNPSYLEEMFSHTKNNDLVFTSRYMKDGGSEDDDIITLIGNKFFSTLGKIFFNLNINDILYTYVLGNTQKVQNLNLNYFDFRICVEFPILAHRSKLNYKCLPCKERKRIAGKKKVNPFKDGLLILFAMFSLYFRK